MALFHGACVNGRATPEYETWNRLIQRCENPKHPEFHNYGGRGISVCKQWRESFEQFLAHIGNKPSPKHTIDRIDNDGNYEPGNVRWATRLEQAQNMRTTKIVTHQGISLSLSAWARRLNISCSAMQKRLNNRNRDPFRAKLAPKNFCKNGHTLSGANIRYEGKARKCRLCHRDASRRYNAKRALLSL